MPDPTSYLSHAKGRPGISMWTVLVVTLTVAAATAVTVGVLRHQAAKSHRAEVLLTLMQGHVHRLNALEWQVITLQKLGPKMMVQIRGVRDEISQTFGELANFDPSEKRLEQVITAYRDYETAVDEELRLIASGKHDLARAFGQRRVDPSFEKFSGLLDDINASFSREAKEKDRSAFVISTFIFLSAATMIGLLFWRFQKTGQTLRLMAAEQGALRWSEERFRSLVQNASDVILLLDADGVVSYASASLHPTLGYSPEDLVNTGILNILCPSDTARMQEILERCIHYPNKSFSSEFCFRHGKGEPRYLDVIVNNRLDEPHVGKIVITCRDITERKQAEEELKSSREQLRNLSAYLRSMREEERTRIAREIHDELGQTLTALKMEVSWLGNRYRDHDGLLEKTKSMTELIDSTIQIVKKISSELRPVLLDDLGLVAAIEWQAEEFQKRTGIECKVTLNPHNIVVDKELSINIFRILQEALTNVIRHAAATQAEVCLEQREGEIVLTIRDNGRGITEDQASDTRSFGLVGMRERASFMGGKARIEGAENKGTIVTVTFPLDGKEEQ